MCIIQNVPKELHCVLPQCFPKSFAWWLDRLFLTLRACTWNIVSLQGVIINSKDLNEHLFNLTSLTSYFPFLSTLSHLLWNLTNAFLWLIHQIGKLEPFWLWVEIWRDWEKWTDVSIFKPLCSKYHTRRFMCSVPLSVSYHMHEYSVRGVLPNYVLTPIFQESSFLFISWQ